MKIAWNEREGIITQYIIGVALFKWCSHEHQRRIVSIELVRA